MIGPNDLQASWIGHGPYDYEPEVERDEDAIYENYINDKLEAQYADEEE